MTVTSAKAPDRYPIPGGDALYLIEIPTDLSKAQYRRSMRAMGARVWDLADMLATARETIDEIAPVNAAEMLAICDRREQLSADAAAEDIKSAQRAWSDLARVLSNAGGDFAAKWADNAFWAELSPLIASRSFLIGTESLRFKRGADGMIPEAALQSIPPLDRVLVGFRALALFDPSEAEAKNSASPQPSSSSPTSSTAASSPSTGPNGPSSESGTSETQN